MLPSGFEQFYSLERERMEKEGLPEWMKNLAIQQQKQGIFTSPVATKSQIELQKKALSELMGLRGKLGLTYEEWKEQRGRAETQRGFVAGEAGKQRAFASSEGIKQRLFATKEAETQRKFQKELAEWQLEQEKVLAKEERKRQKKQAIWSSLLNIGGGILTGGLMPTLIGAEQGTGLFNLGAMAKGGLMGMGGMGQLLGQQVGGRMQLENLLSGLTDPRFARLAQQWGGIGGYTEPIGPELEMP